MFIQSKFEAAMRSFGLIPGGAPVFLAISGGVDSVVLAHLLRSSGFSATWLHVNFQLRGEESERDQRFVESLGKEWNIPVMVNRVDAASYASTHRCSVQEAARDLRYNWFAEVLQTSDKQAVLLTAHHADDNAETLLMNFFRGTGLKGLTGIPVVNDRIRRPLLGITRSDIEAYAKSNDLGFVEDSSNLAADYTRNKWRLEVLPVLRTIYPQVDQTLQQNIERFQSVRLVYEQAVKRWMRKFVECNGAEQRVSVALLLQPEHRAMLHEWLSPYGFTERQESEIVRLADSQSGHFIVSADGTHRVIRHRKHFLLAPTMGGVVSEQWIRSDEHTVSYEDGTLRMEIKSGKVDAFVDSTSVALLDADVLSFPLLLRKWRPGDYFYPIGLNKKKKLARFLIDQKLSAFDKEHVWVLESGQRLVWVIGRRIDHRFRITDTTKQVVRIEWQAKS